MKIRYTIVEDSIWYSVNDIAKWLKEKAALRENHSMGFELVRMLSKRNSNKDAQMNYNQMLCIKPFDQFINWVAVGNCTKFLTAAEKLRVRETKLIMAIDTCQIEGIKNQYPAIYADLQQVNLVYSYNY